MYILASTESDYEVNIYLKYSRITSPVMSWVLQSYSQSNAISSGYEILEGLTLSDIIQDFNSNYLDLILNLAEKYNIDYNSYIGSKLARRMFKLTAKKL